MRSEHYGITYNYIKNPFWVSPSDGSDCKKKIVFLLSLRISEIMNK